MHFMNVALQNGVWDMVDYEGMTAFVVRHGYNFVTCLDNGIEVLVRVATSHTLSI